MSQRIKLICLIYIILLFCVLQFHKVEYLHQLVFYISDSSTKSFENDSAARRRLDFLKYTAAVVLAAQID